MKIPQDDTTELEATRGLITRINELAQTLHNNFERRHEMEMVQMAEHFSNTRHINDQARVRQQNLMVHERQMAALARDGRRASLEAEDRAQDSQLALLRAQWAHEAERHNMEKERLGWELRRVEAGSRRITALLLFSPILGLMFGIVAVCVAYLYKHLLG